MVDVSGHNRTRLENPYHESSFGKYVWGVFGAMLLALMGGVVYTVVTGADVGRFFESAAPTHDFTRVFTYLDAKPLAVVSPIAFKNLLILESEPCDHEAIYAVGQEIAKSDKRWVGDAYFGFGRHCGDDAEGYLREAAGYYNQIGDHRQALRAADTGINQGGQTDADIYYEKAKALGGLGRHEDALPLYERIFSLNGKSKTNGGVFLNAAKQYAALGRFCDAASTMQSNIDSRPNDNLSVAKTMQADYSVKCIASADDSLASQLR